MSAAVVFDTSVLIAMEQGRALGRTPPDSFGVSVVTLAELELGVLVARETATRAQRLSTLTRLREQTAGIAADERVASAYASLAAGELAAGRRPRIHDPWIAATALQRGAQVWTQDADFGAYVGVDVVRV